LLDCATGLQKWQTENLHATRREVCERIAPVAHGRMAQSKFFKLFRGL
jgi:hypothetical protein